MDRGIVTDNNLEPTRALEQSWAIFVTLCPSTALFLLANRCLISTTAQTKTAKAAKKKRGMPLMLENTLS
jgi:hypothetical protein